MQSIPYGDATHGENALWTESPSETDDLLLLQLRDPVLAESNLDQHGCRVAVDGAFGVGLGPRPEESVQRGQVFAEDWVVRFDRVAGQEKLIAAELIDRLSRVEEILITHQ